MLWLGEADRVELRLPRALRCVPGGLASCAHTASRCFGSAEWGADPRPVSCSRNEDHLADLLSLMVLPRANSVLSMCIR